MIDIQVTAAVREQFSHPGDFLQVLAQVSVQIGIWKLFTQPLYLSQQRRGAGGRKTRRDGIAQPLLAVPALNQFAGLAVALLRGFQQFLRRMAVHHHLAGDQPHIQRRRLTEQRFNRLRMHGAEHQRRGGAVA
ncbi:hypothetical protein D3C71_1877590 [compost metagenome]